MRATRGINSRTLLKTRYYANSSVSYLKILPLVAALSDWTEILDAIQRGFVRLIGVPLEIRYLEFLFMIFYNYSNLPHLCRRCVAEVFLFKLPNDFDKCFDLLSEVDNRVPSITCFQDAFSRGHNSYHGPLARNLGHGNAVR